MYYFGFYIRKDSLILFMIGGKTIFRLKTRQSEILGGMMLIFIITAMFMLKNITRRRIGATSMLLDMVEVAFTVMTIFTVFTEISTSMGTIRIQVSCIKCIWMKGRVTMLGTIDAEKPREFIVGTSKMRHFEERQDDLYKFKCLALG